MLRSFASCSQRYFSIVPRFDPEQGTTVFEPEGRGYGHWVGGHSVVYDPEDGMFFLYYRVRHPTGQGRGGRCRIAQSEDGVRFSDIWEATKEQFDAASIEVGTLIRDPDSRRWRLYVSYQCQGGPWRVDLIEADHPRNLDAWQHRAVMQPENYGLCCVKDPRVYIVGGLYAAFVSVSAQRAWVEEESGWRHPLAGDATGLMVSPDGIYFRRYKYVLEPGQGAPGEWGHFFARINSIIYLPPVYVGFFDGGSTQYDDFEEWCGIAVSHDLEHWTRVSTDRPWVRSAHGSLRYLDALRVGDEIWYYYEYAREDGSHELRMSKVRL